MDHFTLDKQITHFNLSIITILIHSIIITDFSQITITVNTEQIASNFHPNYSH